MFLADNKPKIKSREDAKQRRQTRRKTIQLHIKAKAKSRGFQPCVFLPSFLSSRLRAFAALPLAACRAGIKSREDAKQRRQTRRKTIQLHIKAKAKSLSFRPWVFLPFASVFAPSRLRGSSSCGLPRWDKEPRRREAAKTNAKEDNSIAHKSQRQNPGGFQPCVFLPSLLSSRLRAFAALPLAACRAGIKSSEDAKQRRQTRRKTIQLHIKAKAKSLSFQPCVFLPSLLSSRLRAFAALSLAACRAGIKSREDAKQRRQTRRKTIQLHIKAKGKIPGASSPAFSYLRFCLRAFAPSRLFLLRLAALG